MADGRDGILKFCRRNWLGPPLSEEDLLRERPDSRYAAGILFPRGLYSAKFQRDERGDATGGARGSGSEGVDSGLDPIRTAQDLLPASAAISFHTTGKRLTCHVEAGVYSRSSGRGYSRESLADPDVELTPEEPSVVVLDGRAELVSIWRERDQASGGVVTVAIVNSAEYSNGDDEEWEDALFRVGLTVEPTGGTIGDYPSPELLALTEDEEDLGLIYRDRRTVAIGHGCAAAWEMRPDGLVENVSVDFLPHFDVPAFVPREGQLEVLRLGWLADSTISELVPALRGFVAEYEAWLGAQRDLAADVDPKYRPAVRRVVGRLEETVDRMHGGVDLLESDPTSHRAFALANEAMLIQMIQGSDIRAGRLHDQGEAEQERFDSETDWMGSRGERWRPFQLAFQLLALSSSINPGDPHRDLVDLVWFPTGGGKTEAYLAVAATVALHRRLSSGLSPGTDVITRYTYRLLTQQQFLRTARLVCALEVVRRREPELGDEPFTVGLWIGPDTPNKFIDANDRCSEVLTQQRPRNRLGLERCPWCGTRIIPRRRSDRSAYGFDSSSGSFRFHCPDPACIFSDELPVNTVDEHLYRQPPTFLVATVDKFARLVQVEEAGVFLGAGDRLPPGLIIQDELHLLSGPLGTTVGIYEAAISTVCGLHGAPPKMVASTATIRDSDSQVRALYGRNVAVFPPSGLSAGDSWFAFTDAERPGRRYVGVMSPCHTPSTSMVRISAILQQVVNEVDLTPVEHDAYATLVAYHNSLRELGKTVTFARDDIPARMRLVASTAEDLRRIPDDQIVELTSNVDSEEVAALLSRLEAGLGDPDFVAFLATTNMFSVGVDVQRLGLMLVNGQPKTTSDYIQSSSRVGRGKVPGLVVTHYSSTKPRDRSHYEHFRAYHQALYRQVEPTSVTPFSLPSRRRALHASLVLLVRHGLGCTGNDSAGRVDFSSPRYIEAREMFLERVRLADPAEATATRDDLERLEETWQREANQTGDAALYYEAYSPHRGLLIRDDSRARGWKTMNSMRNVDSESPLCSQGEDLETERTIRSSQALVPFGVGAIYDHLGESFVACDTGRWAGTTGRIIPFDRLAGKLGVEEFRLPPVKARDEGCLPFVRFPAWLFCPSCRRMWFWNEETGQRPECGETTCRGSSRLVPMRFLMICRQGHLGDVDWQRWAHSNGDQHCNTRELDFRTLSNRGGGLSSLEIRCRTCGSSRNLNGLTMPGIAGSVGMACSGRQPWEHRGVRACEEVPLIVQRGASNVHYPQLSSALDIPPGSDHDEKKGVAEALRASRAFELVVSAIGSAGEPNVMFAGLFDILLTEVRDAGIEVAEEFAREVVYTRWRQSHGRPSEPVDDGRIDWEEWLAFTSGRRDYGQRSDFIIRPAELFGREDPMPSGIRGAVDELVQSVTLAPRLREIRALTGFSRLYPPGTDPTQTGSEIHLIRPSLDRELPWLPANETFGEGVFMRLNEARVAAWERDTCVRSQVETIAERAERSGRTWLPTVTARLIAIHTLAHLLIRQLCFECGYQSASLRERLYVDDNPDSPMAGLLIYTTSGVTEGSLGGLVRQGEPPHFTRTLLSTLDRARWCPADPVCSETPGGLDSLNHAACHACSLVSETSCTHLNLLLNRDLLVGPDGLARGIVDQLEGFGT